ncbi:MAG TPA: hypothetical protein H9787_08165 [Candidatus Oscillibacter excrementigallinarum]|uniref:Nitric oxide reductase activation protein n=1 Tax=Candidatus Oscillibacter excrementigallinarum TaxID=2838716 RepID=A0A9D2RS46_9FIRM|nr:hypothetical protein [Candidatus Oscillibacter excrementigallinarum]
MEIRDSEKRRARNLIWNAAADYSFEPDFKAYDEEGRADLYWNSIIGAVRKNYGAETIEGLFEALHGCTQEQLYEQLLWLGLENAVYQREAPRRPALPSLRRSYARRVLTENADPDPSDVLAVLENAHFRRALGEADPAMLPRDRELLNALEFPPDLDGPAIAERALDFLHTYFHFTPGQTQAQEAEERRRHRPLLALFRRRSEADLLPSVRAFGHGFGEHLVKGQGGGPDAMPAQRRLTDYNQAQTEAALRKYMRGYFGAPLYDQQQLDALERELCVDDHRGCHLYYATGDDTPEKLKGYVAAQRRNALKQMELNRAAYEADAVRHRTSIRRLTARIRNAMLAYLQPTPVRSASGTLDAGRIWRGIYLDDNKVFTRILQSDPGDLSVDILLDASSSQIDRQAVVAAQGYMIAESLTRCHIPVRVSSFCSLSGYTVVTRYRDYFEADKNERIFNYFTTGCNRDGLAVRALAKGLEDSPSEHKLVILLSDVKPNDVIQINQGGNFVDYARDVGIQNTAMEIRALTYKGIQVMCVFTGKDDDLPAAHTIYGRNFARIRTLDQFADTVGALIQNQIRSL